MNSSQAKLLVVTDDVVSFQEPISALREAGYSVQCESSETQAWEYVRVHQPDIVLCDHARPSTASLELCRRVRHEAALRNIFLIPVLPSGTSRDAEFEFLDAGADTCLFRPLDSREVVSRVGVFARILQQQRALRRKADDLLRSNTDVREASLASLNLMDDALAAQARAEEAISALKRSEEHYRVVFEQASEGIFILDENQRCIGANNAACDLLGRTSTECYGMTIEDSLVPEELHRIQPELAKLASGDLTPSRWHLRRKDGSTFACEVTATRRSDGNLQIFVRDVSENEAAAERQLTLQRTLRTVLEANSLIVRATSEEKLLQDFCDQIVERTNHRLIWVGFVDPATQEVKVAAKAGPATAYLDGIEITAADRPHGRGPTGSCLRTGLPVLCSDLEHDANFELWRERAAKNELRSSIALPLHHEGHCFGAFTIYSSKANRFDHEEIELLAILAGDLSFAIGVLRRERWLRIVSHAVEHSPATVVITNRAGNIEYVNPKFTQITGYTAEEAMGKNPRLLKSGTSSPEIYKGLWETILAGKEWRGEFKNRKKNGDIFWEAAWISGVTDDSGQITRFIAIKEDITAQKEAEHLVREQLARTALLNHITRAIGERSDLSTILRIVAANLEEHLPVDFSMLCLTEPESGDFMVTAVGPQSESLANAAGLDDGTKLAVVSASLERGELIHRPNLETATGECEAKLHAIGLGSLILSPLVLKEQIFGVLVVARRLPNTFTGNDCEFLRQLGEHVALATHQVRMNLELQRANDHLRETQKTALQQERLRALGQMASGVAHDINNAISPISIYSDLLLMQEPPLSAESQDYLKTIQQAAHDVAATVARLREFYRKRESQAELFPVALNRVAKEVMSLTRARWVDIPQERGVTIEFVTDLCAKLPEIQGVESEIREALINLVFNAVDAMPEGGKLTIRTGIRRPASSESPGQVFVDVVDTGHGMDEETRLRCLEPFFTTKGERGTGLGLAMVCGVAQRHDAEFEVESAPGSGTTMRLVFPVPSAPLDAKPTGGAIRVIPRQKILVVDDDPLILRALNLGLQIDGHDVHTADGGKQGIEAFQSALAAGDPFTVVITDLGMPGVDGRAVAVAAKTLAPGTPVILLTGWGQQLAAAGEMPEQVNCMLSKPPKLKEIRDALADCVKK